MVKKNDLTVNERDLFRDLTGALITPVSLAELAAELDCSVSAVRQARLDPGAAGFRNAPDGWELTVLRLLEERSVYFAMQAAKLKDRRPGR